MSTQSSDLHRFAASMIIVVENANPNGDPNQDNMPRTTPGGGGMISAPSIKRKLRDLIVDPLCPVAQSFLEGYDPETHRILESEYHGYTVEELGGSGDEARKKAREMVAKLSKDEQAVLDRYFDARIFGSTLLGGGANFKRRNAVSLSHADSIGRISVVDETITKKHVISNENGDANATFGSMKFVEFGVYVCRISFDVGSARAAQTKHEDIELLKRMLPECFDHSLSFARPAGSIWIRNLFWKDHNSVRPTFSENKFFRSCEPKLKEGVTEGSSEDDFVFADLPAGAVDLMSDYN